MPVTDRPRFWQRRPPPAFARFLASGALCFALNLGVLWVGTGVLGAHYLLSLCVSWIIATFCGWALNRAWTFESKSTHWKRELRRYYAVNLGAFALNFALMAILVTGFHVPYLAASAVLAVVFALGNFVLHRNWSFAAH